jgi:UDP-GlcNAc:undecaprenyl-phosphate GlcNAc-1-phosphate transferase
VSFPLNVYALAFVGALLGSALSLPLWRAWCRRSGHVDDPGHRKIHEEPVPLAGGLAVLTALGLPVLVGAAALFNGWLSGSLVAALQYGFSQRGPQIGAILAGAAAMCALGWLDDRYELRPALKFAGQFLIALGVAAAGVRITLFVPNALFSYAVTILWILTVTNAFNFMDNMNGLCTGLGIMGAWYFGWLAAEQGQYLVASLALLTCGALAGFLPFNFPKASAFLGDAGSHLVGYLMAVLAILPHFYSGQNPHRLAVLSPLLVLAVPLLDLVAVVLIRLRLGKPFYVGDTNHLSHRLVRRGWSKTGAVLLIWLLAAILGSLAFL